MLRFIQSPSPSKDELRFALQALFVSGYKTKQPKRIDLALQKWQESLELDDGYLEGLLASAELYLGEKNYEEASQRFREIVEKYSNNRIHEVALFDYAQTLLFLQRYREGKETFQIYLSTYQNAPRAAAAWQNLVFATVELLKTAEKGELEALRANLIVILQEALKIGDHFAEETLRLYRLQIAQLLFETGNFQEALVRTDEYLKLYPEHTSAREMRLIQVSCCITLNSPVQSLIEALEGAIKQEPDSNLRSRLHLQLFNAYLSQESLNAATEHLLSVYKSGNLTIKAENLLWLAEQVQNTHDLPLAKELLEKALGLPAEATEKSDLDPLAFEEAILILKNLYLTLGEKEKARSALLTLAKRQSGELSIAWRYPRRTQFELAELHEQLGFVEEAMNVYDQLIGDAAFSQASFYLRASILKRAKIQLRTLSEEEKREGAPKLLSILSTLKDLQIARSVESEPIHLEAALEYASLRCSLLPEAHKDRRMIFYLERIEEDFLSGSTETAANYLKDRSNWPEQDALISRYLRFIAAEIKRLQSIEAQKSGNSEFSHERKIEARQELAKLAEELDTRATMLQDRVNNALRRLDTKD